MDAKLIQAISGQTVELEYCPPGRPSPEIFSAGLGTILWNVINEGKITIILMREMTKDPAAPSGTDKDYAKAYNFILKFLTTEHITSIRISAPAHIQVWARNWVKEGVPELYPNEAERKEGHTLLWNERIWDMVEKTIVGLGLQPEARPYPHKQAAPVAQPPAQEVPAQPAPVAATQEVPAQPEQPAVVAPTAPPSPAVDPLQATPTQEPVAANVNPLQS
jgi:hypothetical protein